MELPQTRFLLTGVGLGYFCLLVVFRFRPIAWVFGGLVAVSAIAFWFWQLPTPKAPSKLSTLLDQGVFLERLAMLNLRVPSALRSTWEVAYQDALSAQQSAAQIARKESTLLPDLLDTLHSLLELAEQLVTALQTLDQIHTPEARSLVQQQIQARGDRLKLSCDQLRQLQDQLALDALNEHTITTALPARLHILIADNKSVLS